jgi:hypothetical protein
MTEMSNVEIVDDRNALKLIPYPKVSFIIK